MTLAVVLRDNFTGSGLLTSHTPDTPFLGQPWELGPDGDSPVLNSGSVGYGTWPNFAGIFAPSGMAAPSPTMAQDVALEVKLYLSSSFTASEFYDLILYFESATGGVGSIELTVSQNQENLIPRAAAVTIGLTGVDAQTAVFRTTGEGSGGIIADAALAEGWHTWRVEFSSTSQRILVDGTELWAEGVNYAAVNRELRSIQMQPGGAIDYLQVEASGASVVPGFWTSFRGAYEIPEAP